MKKLAMIAFIGALSAAGSVLAADEDTVRDNVNDVQSDERAIDKDNKSIQNHQNSVEQDRAAKAKAKQNGDYVGQAKESVNIGANKTAIESKKVEKSVDKKILKHHKKQLKKSLEDQDNDSSKQ